MASNNNGKFDEWIICEICEQLFDDPRLAPCSHTYCHKCIKQMAVTNQEYVFECPSGDGCKILKKDIDTLPSNQAVYNLVELFGKFSVLLSKKNKSYFVFSKQRSSRIV
jgi:hypothetical protein